MTVGYVSNWGASTMLEELLAGECYLALHNDDPTVTGLSSTELVGGGYQRQPISFAAAASRAKVSTNAQVFSGLPEDEVPFLAVWTALSGGFMAYAIELDTPIPVAASGQVRVAAGDVAIAF